MKQNIKSNIFRIEETENDIKIKQYFVTIELENKELASKLRLGDCVIVQ